jgi:Protein of unknown function (DUF2591)
MNTLPKVTVSTALGQTVPVSTHDLTGPALRWAVARASGLELLVIGRQLFTRTDEGDEELWEPDAKWHQGGPIIEREQICLSYMDNFNAWHAQIGDEAEYNAYAITPLVAAMRCYVASKLGDSVDVPEARP